MCAISHSPPSRSVLGLATRQDEFSEGAHETPRFHHALRRHCGDLAVRGAGAAANASNNRLLHGANPDAYAPMATVFRKSLNQSGYFETQNVGIEYRWAEGRLERLPELAADLVRRQVSVIFAGGGAESALAAKAATSEIPIVFASGVDPIESGLVASLNRPGGNITGISFLINTLGPKELETLHDLQPKGVIAVLLNPDLATITSQSNDIREAARALGLQVEVFHASTEQEIDTVFASLAAARIAGLVIAANAFFFSRRNQFVGLATRYSIPTVYPWRCHWWRTGELWSQRYGRLSACGRLHRPHPQGRKSG